MNLMIAIAMGFSRNCHGLQPKLPWALTKLPWALAKLTRALARGNGNQTSGALATKGLKFIFLHEFFILFLKALFAMVLFLLVDVIPDCFNLGFPYRHSKKFSLPGKPIWNPFLLIDPKRGFSFD